MSETVTMFGGKTSMTKVEKYGWKLRDEPGEIVALDKAMLQVHPSYQRDLIEDKVRAIAAAWSWIACGSIIVGKRDGEYWTIDGWHRVCAAKQRADIRLLPCLVFPTESIEQEARGFLNANTMRKPVTSLDKFRASLAANDETAIFIDAIFKRFGLIPSKRSVAKNEIKCVALATRIATESREALVSVLELASLISEDSPISEILVGSLHYMHSHIEGGLANKRLRGRLIETGQAALVGGAKRAAAYYKRGGARVWADGMMTEINKGLRNKINLDNSSEQDQS